MPTEFEKLFGRKAPSTTGTALPIKVTRLETTKTTIERPRIPWDLYEQALMT
jgi:hypothetical protein